MFRRLVEKYYLWRYVKFGTAYGDYLSYSYMGQPPKYMEGRFRKLSTKIWKLGFQPLEHIDFVRHGGYGKPLPKIKRRVK